MAIKNQNPKTAVHFKVNFMTTDLNSGNRFIEPHTVSGPIGGNNTSLNSSNIIGNKIVVPLQTTTGPGSFWLKFHLPQPNLSVMYITFAQKNSNMSDGYYDYQTGIPNDYRNALISWIKNNTTTNSNRDLLFNVYGLDTNQVSSSIQYKVRFATKSQRTQAPALTPTIQF